MLQLLGFKAKSAHSFRNKVHYDSLVAALNEARSLAFRNKGSDCEKLMRLACLLCLKGKYIQQHIAPDQKDKLLKNFWLKVTKSIGFEVECNFYTIVQEEMCEHSICLEKLIRQHCVESNYSSKS